MRIPAATMYPGVAADMQDRKRKRDDLLPASDQHLVPALHFMDSAPTSLMPENLLAKRQHLLSQEACPLPSMSIDSTTQRPSPSGSLTSSQPSEQTDLHMTASDASNSVGRQPEVTVMEQDQQSVAPAPASQQQNQNPARGPGMSHSSSAPDLRLMLATELPDNRPMFLPVPGSYAGALVPYKSPESCIAEAHQHVTTDLINHMIDEFNTAQAHQGADNEEASVDMAVKVGSVADGLAPAVHTAVQHDAEGVLDLQTRKRKLQELPFCPSKWAKGSSSQHCMLLDSSCDVEMKDS